MSSLPGGGGGGGGRRPALVEYPTSYLDNGSWSGSSASYTDIL